MPPAWMKTKVKVAPQAEQFVKALAPEPQTRLSRAIKALSTNSGDTKMLEGPLASYGRIRSGGFRVIYAEQSQGGERVINSLFAERRSVVYEVFEKLLAEQIAERNR